MPGLGKRNHTIEVGRVVEVNYGKDAGKLAVIIDIVDQSRALVDGPAVITGVQRQTLPYRDLSLTHILIPLTRSVKSATLANAWKKANVEAQWSETSWAKKAELRKTRANLTDFERFQALVLKKKRNSAIAREIGAIKRAKRGGNKKGGKAGAGGKQQAGGAQKKQQTQKAK